MSLSNGGITLSGCVAQASFKQKILTNIYWDIEVFFQLVVTLRVIIIETLISHIYAYVSHAEYDLELQPIQSQVQHGRPPVHFPQI